MYQVLLFKFRRHLCKGSMENCDFPYSAHAHAARSSELQVNSQRTMRQ